MALTPLKLAPMMAPEMAPNKPPDKPEPIVRSLLLRGVLSSIVSVSLVK
jgi:hypothetical protein